MRNVSRSLGILAGIVSLVALSATSGNAQTSNGTIAGTITDASGAAIVRAAVVATSQDLGKTLGTASTDSAGGYRIDALFPGKYTVSVKAPGFNELKVSDVDVRGSYVSTVNGTLEVGAVTSTVTVEASVGQELQTQSGEITKSFGESEIANLPYANLNPISLVLTGAGVTAGNQVAGGITNNSNFGFRTNGQQFSVNGTSPRANNFLIDGQDNNDNSIAGQAFQPDNQAAYGEVTILTNSYAAEFGRGGGSVTNVISRGGTNSFHGSAWELNRNTYYSAIPADQGFNGVCSNPGPNCSSVGNPVDNENTFGYAFGGPILKNKLFFFQTTQWDRDRVTANGSTLHIPTANGISALQGLGPNANIDYLVAALAGLRGVCRTTPCPTLTLGNDPTTGNPRPDVEMGTVERAGIGEKSNARTENVKVDWIAAEKDSFSARYIRSDAALTPDLFNFPSQLQPFDSQQGGPSQTIGTTWVHTFSARAVNEFRASFTEINFSFGPTSATAANPLSSHASISISGLPTLGFPSNLPQGRGHKTWQYQDAFSYSIGKHSIKVGADVTYLAVVDLIPFNSRGTISYVTGGSCGTGITCSSLANYVDDFGGPSGTAAKVFGSPVTKPFVTTYAPYAQDTWRLTTNFTLDLGLRYEYWGTPENTLLFPAADLSAGIGLLGQSFPNKFSHPQQGDLNNFAPRVGLAYTPRMLPRLFGHGKTVIRAGYGIFYDGIFTNILDNTAGASPNAIGFTATSNAGRGVANISAALAAAQAVLNPAATVTTIADNLRNPLTQQWNLNIQRELPGGFLLTTAYVGTRGERLFISQAYNPRVVTVPGTAGSRVNTSEGPITVRNSAGDSIYHGGQFQLDRKFSHGLQLRAAYTYSKLLDNGSDVFGPTGGNTINRNDFAQNPLCQSCDRGPSIFDIRHRFVATYIWDLPYQHSPSNHVLGIVKSITRDWTISGTTTAQTGFNGTIFNGVDSVGDGQSFNDRPQIADATKGIFDKARYLILPANTGAAALVGTIGRGSAALPGFQNWDFSVQRLIKLPMRHFESQSLTLRGEAYNVFNHPSLGIPDLNLSASDFGDLPSTIYGGRVMKIRLAYAF